MSANEEREAGLRTLHRAITIARERGEVRAAKFFSTHPDDDYLYVVLVGLIKGPKHNQYREYVTWIVNTSSGGCGEGHYFMRLDDAVADFNKRGYPTGE